MTCILVLQWSGSTEADFDELIEIEDQLAGALAGNVSVDGHDFGSGEMNIFIEADEPLRTFEAVAGILRDRRSWAGVRAAYRELAGEGYTVLWPVGLTDFRIQ